MNRARSRSVARKIDRLLTLQCPRTPDRWLDSSALKRRQWGLRVARSAVLWPFWAAACVKGDSPLAVFAEWFGSITIVWDHLNVTAPLTVITGPLGSGLSNRLLERYRAVLGGAAPASVLWLAPTGRVAADIRGRLLDSNADGYFNPGVMTFAGLAEMCLQSAPEHAELISPLMKRHLIRRLIDQHLAEGRLKHFGPIATSGGLLDLVCDFVRELKRLEVWPDDFRRACQSRGVSQKDEELLAIYEAYQQRLLEHHLYDAEGRLWSARDWLRKGPGPQFRLIVADGFTDFTRTEHEILQTLARRAEEAWISLPIEAEPRRPDLFNKPLATLAELEKRHPGMKVVEVARAERAPWPAMAHVERMLFANPRRVEPASDTEGIEILAGGRRLGEIELIGSRIKRLLIEGDTDGHGQPVRPGQIVVVFRRPREVCNLLGEVFTRLQLPFALPAGQPLDRSPALVMLASLLQLDAEDWPLPNLLAILGNNYFRPDWHAWHCDALMPGLERTLRQLRVPEGRKSLLERLAAAEPSTAVESARAVLQGLAAALDELPQRATLADWGLAWERLADRVGLRRAMREGKQADAVLSDRDEAAWRCLTEALDESQRLARRLGQDTPELDRAQARIALLDILRSQETSPGGDESGRVRVLSAAAVRGLRVPYLFVAGLGEKAFPSPDREDRLYGLAENQQLIKAGLPLPSRSDRQTDEMLLFYEVIASATKRLYLSYPAIDDSGEPLAPSPYLKEVEQACGQGRIARHQQLDLSPVPSDDALLSSDALRLRAIATAIDGKVDLLAGLMQHDARTADSLSSGLQLISLRQSRDAFGFAEGMLSQAVAARLAAAFSPERIFTVTELESYASCPYQYFLARLLKVEPVEEAELEVDYLERGRLAHELLAALHRRINEEHGGLTSPASIEPEEYERLLAETLAELLPAESNDWADGMREVDRRLLLQWIADYRSQHERYDALWPEFRVPMRPEFFEVLFGRRLREKDGPPSTEEPLELDLGGADDSSCRANRPHRYGQGQRPHGV